MQVTEANVEGLRRNLKIVVGAQELMQRLTKRIDELKDQVQLKGFRKGKVPPSHIRKVFGRSIMAEMIQQTVDEASRKAITDRGERPAQTPEIDLTEDKDEIERVIAGQSDLAYTLKYEALPKIELADFSSLKLERLVADVPADAIDKGIGQLQERNIGYEAEAGRSAGKGDEVTLDFVGRIDGVEFDGGKAEGVPLVLGSGGFIPGFEDGLEGAKAGEERKVSVSFPAEYPKKELAGKPAIFDVRIVSVGKPVKPEINDDFAKGFGAESVADLRKRVAEQIGREYEQVARQKLKRSLFDELDKVQSFALPETLVDNEFDGIWKEVTQSLERAGKTLADEGKTEESAKAEYRKIAERRVRLGLLIGEIGDRNKIEVTEEELKAALVSQARQFPGRTRELMEFYQKNPGALAHVRAPIFEDKVVDHVLSLASPVDRKVSVEELLKPIPDEDAPVGGAHNHTHNHDHHHGHDHDHDHDHHHHGHDHAPKKP
jgi:trigger factor